MEHRKFQRRVAELAAELTLAQAGKLIDALTKRDTGDETRALIDGAFQTDVHCPHCQGCRIHRQLLKDEARASQKRLAH